MNADLDSAARRGAEVLAKFCGQVRQDDRALIVTDQSTEEVGRYIFNAASRLTSTVKWMKTKQQSMHGSEPPEAIAKDMLNSDIIFGATKFSMAHTKARKLAMDKGARYLSLPDYSIEQLASPALDVDYVKWAKVGKKLENLLASGQDIEITTEKGTMLKLNYKGRQINLCPGFCPKRGTLGSPPDIEINVPPLEDKSNGLLIVDGSVPCAEVGVVEKDIMMKIRDGSIAEISPATEQGRILNEMFAKQGSAARVLAEFGIGLNPKAKLCGRMLEDEGCLGTIHLGFGSNATIGGRNKANFHLDFVIRSPTVLLDGREIMKQGSLLV